MICCSGVEASEKLAVLVSSDSVRLGPVCYDNRKPLRFDNRVVSNRDFGLKTINRSALDSEHMY